MLVIIPESAIQQAFSLRIEQDIIELCNRRDEFEADGDIALALAVQSQIDALVDMRKLYVVPTLG